MTRPYRFWTEEETAELVRLYPTTTAADLGRRFGRTTRSIYNQVIKLRLAQQTRVVVDEAFDEALTRRNAEGWPDTEIAAELGCDRHVVSRRRLALGLCSQARSERVRRKVAAGVARQCERLGVARVQDLRTIAWARLARSKGWPEDLRWRAVQILDALDKRGPMTRQEICEAVGMPWKGSRKSLVSNDKPGGSYLAGLARRGLVISLGRIVRMGGKSRNVQLYSLSPLAQRRLPDATA